MLIVLLIYKNYILYNSSFKKYNLEVLASDPITSWQIDEETVETVADFIFWGSKITADGNCSHEIKRRLLLGRKAMINLDNIFGEGNGTPLQYSCLENPMDGGAWWAAVHEVAKSQTRLSNFTFTFHFHALEKEMATHSSVLAWRIPWTVRGHKESHTTE